MIKNEDLIRMPIHKLDRLRKMFLENQDVVSQIESLQCSDAAIEVVAQHELIIRFVMKRMSYCFHFGQGSDAFELG